MTVVSNHVIALVLVLVGSLVGSKKCLVIITPPIRTSKVLVLVLLANPFDILVLVRKKLTQQFPLKRERCQPV